MTPRDLPDRRRTILTVVLLAAPTLVLYASGLGRSPIYLAHDEVFFALNAHAIASTARDAHGRFLPLYFQIIEDVWFQPILVYFTALFLKVLPVSEWAVRLPTACVGAIDVVLVYFIGRRLFKREGLAILAAGLLALTPAHVVHSRIAMDYLYPVPFMMAWLLCLLIFLERHQPWLLFAGAMFLGVGFYSYIASVVMMPFYLLLTFLTLFRTDKKPLRLCAVAAGGFILPVSLLIVWAVHHPKAIADTAGRYELGGQTSVAAQGSGASMPATAPISLSAVMEKLRSATHFSGLTGRISLYWYFFDPSFLFLTGGSNVLNSTQRAGVFLLSFAVFLPVGASRIVTARRTWPNLLLLVGFLSAPLAACLVVPEPYAIDRELEVLPFAVLIAVYGVDSLWSAPRKRWRGVAVCAVVLMPIQFGYFYVDYFTGYRVRSAYWFERNVGGALDGIIDREPQERPPSIYLSTRVTYIEWYWKLYLAKHGREDLLARTVYVDFEQLDVHAVPARSLMFSTAKDARAEALVLSGDLRRVAFIPEPDEPPSFSILER